MGRDGGLLMGGDVPAGNGRKENADASKSSRAAASSGVDLMHLNSCITQLGTLKTIVGYEFFNSVHHDKFKTLKQAYDGLVQASNALTQLK